jgi:hypothetical protein
MTLATQSYPTPSLCNHVTTEDLSTYGVSPDSRSNYGLALFVLEGGVPNDLLSDLTNSDPWSTPTASTSTVYTFSVFAAPLWVAGAYNAGTIVFYSDGNFYQNSSGAVNNNEPTVGPGWTIMTTSNYAAFLASGIDNVTNTLTMPLFICQDMTISRTSCLNYSVCNNTGADQYFIVKDVAGTIQTITTDATPIYDSNNVLIAYMIPTMECVDVAVSDTGVYIFWFGTGSTSMPYADVVFELCEYYTCYFSLVKQILCSDIDPCCQECAEEAKRQNEIFRFTLNKMQALINTLQIKIGFDSLTYKNTITITDDRETLLAEIADILLKLDDIIIRCGLCEGAQTNTVTSPCTNC